MTGTHAAPEGLEYRQGRMCAIQDMGFGKDHKGLLSERA